ncbi:MAG: efflux RND transporter periplasmic adaptor subunit [Alphaproteobacteria bacterium]|nr:efflux RND transporter periplasmic adaptor subunit [Alphaproteobacteria bacterium]
MLKRFLGFIVAIGFVAAFFATLGFLWWKSSEPEEAFTTVSPKTMDIVLKTVATGAIEPRNKVDVKSRVSGVVDSIHVEAGDLVQAGDLLATVRVQPDSVSLNNADSRVRSARIASDDARSQLSRGEALFGKGAISQAELDRLKLEADLRSAELQAARNALVVVREGALRGSGPVATEVRATVSGMVLAVPVKEGHQVTESNTFNDGTTVATVADMTDMIFVGQVDESEVGRIREGMPIDLKVGAIRDRRFGGTLEYISPMGNVLDGSVQFEIRAALEPVEGVFIRAGSSANADIVLQRTDEVLAINESVVQFDKGQPYVEIEVGDQVFERRDVELGLSDGIHVEVVGGIEAADKVKKPS